MMWRRLSSFLLIALVAFSGMGAEDGCQSEPMSSSGLRKATTHVRTGPSGFSVEQESVMNRLNTDNRPGSIKHLYVISAYSGQVLVYSTVRGKVTSSGKRLTPSTVVGCDANAYGHGFKVRFPGMANDECTNEVLSDDGTYGDSVPYIYWWDTRGVYHQHFPAGGQIIHVSDQPLAVKGIVINMELKTLPAGP